MCRIVTHLRHPLISNSEKAALKLDGANGSASQSAAQKWNSLSSSAKIGIGASVAGVLVLSILIFAFCCIKQRRAGKRERMVEDAKFEKDQAELMAYRAQMSRMRSEKLASAESYPLTNNVGASFAQMNGSTRSVNSVPYSDQGYARSVNSFGGGGGGRGYQRY